MPIDLVIDERETGPGTKAEGLPGDSNNNANRSNADSASHTDGASTPEVVSQIFRFFLFIPVPKLKAEKLKIRPSVDHCLFKSIMGQSTVYHVYEETPILELLRQTDIFPLLFPCILLGSQISDMQVI